MEKKLKKKVVKHLLEGIGFGLIIAGIVVMCNVFPAVIVYRFPPDICEWVFGKSPQDFVSDPLNQSLTSLDEDGNLLLVAPADYGDGWLQGADTTAFDSAMQNKNIQISSDFTRISVTCNDAETWESDFRTAENATIICILKQLINSVQPENLSVTIDLIDGVIGETVYRIDYPPGMYSFNSHEIFSFME